MPDPTDATLIRQYADGELTPDEAAAFEQRLQSDPDLRAAVEFERTLRTRVAAVMQTDAPAAPADLADRIHAALAGADSTQAADAPDAPDATPARPETGPVAGRIGPGAPPAAAAAAHDRGTGGSRRPRANIFMIAATLVLVAGAILIGIFGPSIDQLPPAGDLVVDAADWVSSEHGRCTTDTDVVDTKLSWHDPAEARRQLAAHLQVSEVSIPLALEEIGYEFVGAGRCMLPAGGLKSGHMLFERSANPPAGPAMLSLFVVPDVGQYNRGLRLGMIPGRWYTTDGGPKCARMIRRTTDGAVVYFLVCCDEGDLGVAEQTIGLQLTGVR
jgi:hypothetical protein